MVREAPSDHLNDLVCRQLVKLTLQCELQPRILEGDGYLGVSAAEAIVAPSVDRVAGHPSRMKCLCALRRRDEQEVFILRTQEVLLHSGPVCLDNPLDTKRSARADTGRCGRTGGRYPSPMGAYDTGRFADVDPSDVDSITTLGELERLLELLYEDFRQTGREEWENRTLESYLGALVAVAQDLPGLYQNKGEAMPVQPTWRTLGMLLVAASGYE